MSMSTIRRSFTIEFGLIVAAFLLCCGAPAALAQSGAPNSFGPSIAGRIYSWAIDPTDSNVVYAGGDVCGVYRSADFGASWRLWNEGLESADVTASYYVDDILVVPGIGDLELAPNRAGVYAATLGGIYFRPSSASGSWTLQTDYSSDSRYYYNRTDDYASQKGYPVPFCALAYDEVNHVLYAGAGNCRNRDSQSPSAYKGYSYPALTDTTGASRFDPGAGGVSAEYVIWSLDLKSSASTWEPVLAGGSVVPSGLARQLAVFESDLGRFLAVATSEGVFLAQVGPASATLDWSSLVDPASKTDVVNLWTGFLWGLAAGADGRLYVLQRAALTNGSTKPSGVFFRDVNTGSGGRWSLLENPAAPEVLPYDHEFEGYPGVEYTFLELLNAFSPTNLDLQTIAVRPGADASQDEVFVGGRQTSRGGYFRYGRHRRVVDGSVVELPGWIQYVYRNPSFWNNFTYYGIAWNDTIASRTTLYSEAAGLNNIGWLTNNTIDSNVPVVWSPGGEWMMMDLYHSPLRSTDHGTSWSPAYCRGSGDAWSGSGLNMDTTNDIVTMSDGRLAMSTNDFGAFEQVIDGNSTFQWSTWNAKFWARTFVDLEVVDRGSTCELLGWNARDGRLQKRNWAASAHDSSTWGDVGAAINGLGWLGDVLAFDANTLLLAPSGSPGLWKCERQSSGEFGVLSQLPHPSGVPSFKYLCRIPSTDLVLAASQSSVMCFDLAHPTENPTVWLQGSSGGTSIERAATGISAIWADRLGRVVYVGTSGNTSPPEQPGQGASPRLGTAIRIDGPFPSGVAPQTSRLHLLANSGPSDHPFGFADAQFGCIGHEGQANERYTCVRSVVTDFNNPNRVYVGLGMKAIDDAGNMHPNNGVWLYDEAHPANGSPWRQVFGKQHSPSWGMNRPVTVMSTGRDGPQLAGALMDTLLIGTDGQGPFWLPIELTVPPSIASAATYPVFADAIGVENALGVHVTPAANTSTDTVTVDLRPWGGGAYEPLRDDGVAPDLTAGDGIYTSGLLSANFGDPGTISVNVFAQASDGGYASRAVALQVIGNPIAENAAYRFRAGSTDTSYVFAVSVSSPPSWRQVTTNLTAVSGPANIELKDDGAGEDVKSGDGIFTSPRFAASMPNQGTYIASVTAKPMVGGSVTQAVNMSAIVVAAKFKNDSELADATRLGNALMAGLTARPYSSVYFQARPNDSARKSVMIATFDDNTTPPRIWGRIQVGGVEGSFADRGVLGSIPWINADMPAGSRGVCYADVDNDGDTDFFLCNPLYGGKLFVNHLYDTSCPSDWQGKFVDQTSTYFGTDTVYLDGAVAASWGDYTGDGFVDLFVATATYTGPIDDVDDMEAPTLGAGSGDLKLFKNTMGGGLRKSKVWGSGYGSICLSGCWADLDDDGDLDLLTSRYVDGGLSVLENHGITAAHTDMDMVETVWSLSDEHRGINSIATMDYNHDAFPDLVITEVTQAQQRACVLWTDAAHVGGKAFFEAPFGVGHAWTGAVVADFNLDGRDDFALMPRDADVAPALFMSNGYTIAPAFEDPDLLLPLSGGGTTPIYRELGYTLGLRDGRTGGGFATDLDGDRAPDLFLGRSGADPFLYRSASLTGEASHSLQVKLRTIGNSNGSLIGTKVEVAKGSKRWRKSVDGGSIRGGQSSNDLLFGLGSESSVDSVRVVFPSGEVDVAYPAAADTVTVWENEPLGNLSVANPRFTYELHPGRVDWVFRWRSPKIKGDLRQDRVVITPWADETNPCYDMENPAPPTTLQWGVPDVSASVYRDGAYWIHEMRWFNTPCFTGCRRLISAFSCAGAGSTTKSVVMPAVTAPSYCLPETYGP